MRYTYNRIFFSLKKEGNSAICYNMDELGCPHATWNKPDRKGYCMIPLTWGTCSQTYRERI